MSSAILKNINRFNDRILTSRTLPAREAHRVALPEELHPDLAACIRQQGFEQLYSHQAELFARAAQRKSVVITTGTASGKSLSFYLPVMQRILEHPSRRALFIYPTKALAKDQLRNLLAFTEYFGKERIQVGIYDGDTPPAERSRIRERANIILTNPDMLNASFLPNHTRYGFPHLFANLDFVVIDELHAYRGAFGSHVSNLFRRLLRICDFHGNKPQFLCSSATIANPRELAENICHTPFECIEKDGSPAPEKVIHFWQPEFIQKAQRKRAVTEELKSFLPNLIAHGVRLITFCMSRRETEVVTKETRDVLALDPMDYGINMADKVSAYRGGYTPLERARIEKQLVDGDLFGVVSTSALELGIDIGALDLVVMGGFPGTRASFWQQLGRAGRKGNRAHAVLMLKEKPMDQYVGMHPDWLLKSDAENAVIDKNNLFIQLAHIRAASAELPLSIDDVATFPDLGEIIPLLVQEGEVSEHHGQYQWSGNLSPAQEISLRNITSDSIKVVDSEQETTITVVDLIQAKKEFYPGAIYLHDSVQYKSIALNLEEKVALVKKVDSNYYTEPHKPGNIDILMEQQQKQERRIKSFFGDVRISVLVTGYKMVEFNTHQNLGFESLSEVYQTQMETEACWIQIPDNVVRVFVATGKAPAMEPAQPVNKDKQVPRFDYSEGLVHALRAAASMRVMATPSDLGGDIFGYVDPQENRQRHAVILFDEYPGGLGFSEKAHEQLQAILLDAGNLVKDCPCKNGCPACVGDHRIDKQLILWALRNLFRELPAPSMGGISLEKRPLQKAAAQGPKIRFAEIESQWEQLLTRMQENNRFGARFLAQATAISINNTLLSLYFEPSVLNLANNEEVRNGLRAELMLEVELPDAFELRFLANTDEQNIQKQLKLRRYFGQGGDEQTK